MREPVCLGGKRGPPWPHPFARHDLALGPNGLVQPAGVSRPRIGSGDRRRLWLEARRVLEHAQHDHRELAGYGRHRPLAPQALGEAETPAAQARGLLLSVEEDQCRLKEVAAQERVARRLG